ncbi:MAG: polymer-forming cytoskeletal protein [Candidatus Omnitrophica bacterium]|nr:polymer-forming cytoskeletal protein [Candidatus Omnitrophota bacterium]
MKLEFGKVRFWALWTGYFMALALSAKALEAERGERPEQLIHRSEMVVIGQNVVLRPNEVCNEMVVISGSARIEGTVQGDVVVVAGSAEVEGTISGDLVVIQRP